MPPSRAKLTLKVKIRHKNCRLLPHFEQYIIRNWTKSDGPLEVEMGFRGLNGAFVSEMCLLYLRWGYIIKYESKWRVDVSNR
jgi:hypothetical protein